MRMVPQVWAFPPSILVGSPSIRANRTSFCSINSGVWRMLLRGMVNDGQKSWCLSRKPRNMNPVVLSLFAALFTNDLLDLKARQEQRWDLAYAYAALDTLPHTVRSKPLIFPFLFMSFAKGLLARVDVTVSSRRKTSSWMTPKSLEQAFQTIPPWCCVRWPCFWGWCRRWRGGHGKTRHGGVRGSDCRTWCKRTSHPLFRWWSLSTWPTLRRMRCSSTGDSHVFHTCVHLASFPSVTPFLCLRLAFPGPAFFCLEKGQLYKFIRDTVNDK